MFTNQKFNRSEFLCPFIYLSVTLQSTSHILLLLLRIIPSHTNTLLEKRQESLLMSQWSLTFCRKKQHLPAQSCLCSYSMNHYTYKFYHSILVFYCWKHSWSKSLTFSYDKTTIYEQICNPHIFISVPLCVHRDRISLEHYNIWTQFRCNWYHSSIHKYTYRVIGVQTQT